MTQYSLKVTKNTLFKAELVDINCITDTENDYSPDDGGDLWIHFVSK